MESNQGKQLLEEAGGLIERALDELDRPEEDVVRVLICRNANQAINKYLQGYLMMQGELLHADDNISDLVKRCVEKDQDFASLNIQQVYCRYNTGEEMYCLNTPKAKECLEVAKLISVLVNEKVTQLI